MPGRQLIADRALQSNDVHSRARRKTAACSEGPPPWLTRLMRRSVRFLSADARRRDRCRHFGRLRRRLDAVLGRSRPRRSTCITTPARRSIWAQHFAFGYKHPPLTGWLFALWFSVFPHAQWAMNLLTVLTSAVGLAVGWRLLRDHLDRNRALLGLFALMLIPLYDVKAEVLNANTVMIPVWAAALLFYLRARRGLGQARCVLGRRVRQPHDARQILGGVFVRRHGGGGADRAGRAALLAFACAVPDGPGSRDRHRSASVVDADAKRRQRAVRRERGQSHAVLQPHWRSRRITSSARWPT